jgi:U32 family peptidase
MVKEKTKTKEKTKAKEKPIGEVVHFFSNIEVAVIKLASPLVVGDEIRIVGGEETDFNQKVSSMQIEHEKIEKAKKGSEVGMKVKEKVREGYKVYKV